MCADFSAEGLGIASVIRGQGDEGRDGRRVKLTVLVSVLTWSLYAQFAMVA